jgi:hypothetical protein
MIGVSLGGDLLVTRSYKEDGIYFIIFALALLSFLLKDRIGKYLLLIWLLIWFVTQFYSHWYVTIFGPWEGKRRFFAHTIKLIPSDNIYIPDLYHIVLHILILLSLGGVIAFLFQKRKRSSRK